MKILTLKQLIKGVYKNPERSIVFQLFEMGIVFFIPLFYIIAWGYFNCSPLKSIIVSLVGFVIYCLVTIYVGCCELYKGERMTESEQMERKKLLDDIQDFIDAIYEISNVGGALHNVLDDDNFKDVDIQFCLDKIIPAEPKMLMRVLCQHCAELLLKIPEAERIEYFCGGMYE